MKLEDYMKKEQRKRLLTFTGAVFELINKDRVKTSELHDYIDTIAQTIEKLEAERYED